MLLVPCGFARYSQLYACTEKTTSRHLTPARKATVRREIENHSINAGNYKDGGDLFFTVEPLDRKRAGIPVISGIL